MNKYKTIYIRVNLTEGFSLESVSPIYKVMRYFHGININLFLQKNKHIFEKPAP